MAAAALKRWRWPLAAALAAGLIVALSLHGERPSLLHEAVENGVMHNVDLARIRWVEVGTGNGHWRFERDGTGRWTVMAAERPPPPDFGKQIDIGLRLLHDSAPLGALTESELADRDPAQFGLTEPVLTLALGADAATSFTVAFGAPNPIGLANYARVGGRTEVTLINDYVLAAWQQAVGRQ